MTVDTDIAGRLIGVLRSTTGTPGLEYARGPEPLRGGFWAELLSFSLANPPDGWPAELVARLMPDPDTARKETIVQRAVAAAGFPTPIVEAGPVSFACRCSRERVAAALIAMGRAELTDVLAGDRRAEVICEFCAQRYVVEEPALRALLTGSDGDVPE